MLVSKPSKTAKSIACSLPNWFDVAPFTEARQQISRMEGTLNEASRQSSSNLVEGLLPRGILFQSGEIASDARGAQLISDTARRAGGGGE